MPALFYARAPLLMYSIQIVFCLGWWLVSCLHFLVTPAASSELRENALGWILLLCEGQGCLINISALLTLALGLWFLTEFSPPITPSFLLGDQWAPLSSSHPALVAHASWVSCSKGLVPPLGQGSLVYLPLIDIRVRIWVLLVWYTALHLVVSDLGLIFHAYI